MKEDPLAKNETPQEKWLSEKDVKQLLMREKGCVPCDITHVKKGDRIVYVFEDATKPRFEDMGFDIKDTPAFAIVHSVESVGPKRDGSVPPEFDTEGIYRSRVIHDLFNIGKRVDLFTINPRTGAIRQVGHERKVKNYQVVPGNVFKIQRPQDRPEERSESV